MSADFTWMSRLIPEAILVVTAFVVLTFDLVFAQNRHPIFRVRFACYLVCLGCVGAIAWLTVIPGKIDSTMLSASPLTQFLKLALLVVTIFIAVMSLGTRFTRHIGEYFALLVFAAVGMLLVISSDNLLMIFVAVELLSLSFYVLTAFNKSSPASGEAALKYFLFGGMAAAFTLFGISLIYGITGEIQLAAVAAKLRDQTQLPLFDIALVMTLAGFAFKLAAAPFHFWAPDVYEGAPTPIASFIASGSKIASFFVLGRILLTGFASAEGSAAFGHFATGWMPVIAALAIFSIVAGNIAALVQTSVKRLLAYSAIAHAGYGLLSFFADPKHAVPALLFFVITYAFAVLGAFAVVLVLEQDGARDKLTDFGGLARRAPVLSFCMLIFMLSLAGIPPLSGFFGKFYIFTAAAAGAPNLGMLWLVAVAVAASAVSLYYYLQVLKQIYAATPQPTARPLHAPISAVFPIVALAVIVIGLGCAPDLLLGKLSSVIQSSIF